MLPQHRKRPEPVQAVAAENISVPGSGRHLKRLDLPMIVRSIMDSIGVARRPVLPVLDYLLYESRL